MITKFKQPNILVLKNVKKSELENYDIITATMTENAQNNLRAHMPIYTGNPPVFYNMSEWPAKSNCRCWNCNLFFDTRPYPVIMCVRKLDLMSLDGLRQSSTDINTDSVQENSIGKIPHRYKCDYICNGIPMCFDTRGNFCSRNCAKSFIKLRYSHDGTYDDKCKNLLIWCRLLDRTSGSTTVILDAPDHTEMQEWAGASGTTAEKYRDAIKALRQKEINYNSHGFISSMRV